MGKDTPSAPTYDANSAINQQSAANLDTAIAQGWLNAMNQKTPYGSVTYNQSGTKSVGGKDVPIFEQNISLTPEQQKQLDIRNSLQTQALNLGGGVLNNVGAAVSNPFSLQGLPAAATSGDFAKERDFATQSIINRNQPVMDRDRAMMETKLANQGVMPGSEAYMNAMDDLNRQQNDFRLAAINAGGAEQNRLFNLANTARNQGITERSLERSQPINEYATLLGLGGNVQTPQISQSVGGTIQPTDVMGALNTQYQGQLAGYNADRSASNAAMGGLFGLGGAAISAGLPWYLRR
jgi:hypothetical protein